MFCSDRTVLINVFSYKRGHRQLHQWYISCRNAFDRSALFKYEYKAPAYSNDILPFAGFQHYSLMLSTFHVFCACRASLYIRCMLYRDTRNGNIILNTLLVWWQKERQMYDVCMVLTYNVLIIITWENNWIYMYFLSISTKHILNMSNTLNSKLGMYILDTIFLKTNSGLWLADLRLQFLTSCYTWIPLWLPRRPSRQLSPSLNRTCN